LSDNVPAFEEYGDDRLLNLGRLFIALGGQSTHKGFGELHVGKVVDRLVHDF
jgi:hypothetical protein